MPDTFTVRQVRERYGVSEQTVLHWLRSGQLRGLNVGRSLGTGKPRWRITAQALKDFEAARTTTPAAPRRQRRKQQEDVIEFYRWPSQSGDNGRKLSGDPRVLSERCAMKTVNIGKKKIVLPFLDLIPIAAVDKAELLTSIGTNGMLEPVVGWKQKSTSALRTHRFG